MPIPDGIKSLILKKDPNIKQIDLSYQSLNNADMFTLSDLLEQNQYITSLNLKGNNIRSDGAKTLANLKLDELDVSNNRIGNEGGIALLQSRTVKRVMLEGNGITRDTFAQYGSQNIVIDPIISQALNRVPPNRSDPLLELAARMDRTSHLSTKVARQETSFSIEDLQQLLNKYLSTLPAVDERTKQAIEETVRETHVKCNQLDEKSKLVFVLSLASSLLPIAEKDHEASPSK